jgi:DNA-binding response OmpR family regulator
MIDVKTIIVIEDSQIISEIITLQLKRNFNCNVITLKNGDNVFYNVNKFSPDLIILDYNFNDSKLKFNNGLEVLIELRKDSEIPVIVFSGQRDMGKAIEIVQK